MDVEYCKKKESSIINYHCPNTFSITYLHGRKKLEFLENSPQIRDLRIF